MKVFLSWSGDRSFEFASILSDWIPKVIQACKPWLSAKDIDKGAKWFPEISKELQESKAGIICLTNDNLDSPWILFESGAISKTVEKSFVCPYLLDIKPTDIKGPLSQFQSTKAEKNDTLLLIKTINKILGQDALQEKQLESIFSKWWPDLEADLKKILPIKSGKKEQRSDRELLEEILEVVRSLIRSDSAQNIYSSVLASLLTEASASSNATPTASISNYLKEYVDQSSKSRGMGLRNAKLFLDSKKKDAEK